MIKRLQVILNGSARHERTTVLGVPQFLSGSYKLLGMPKCFRPLRARIFYPLVNTTTMRLTSYVGIMFGVTNEVEWFILNPSMWWIGIMHIPLITIPTHAFAITFRHKRFTLA